jgi:hypothetical protein
LLDFEEDFDAEQLSPAHSWCPELDGETRVSSLQTGVHSGEVGSKIWRDLRVRDLRAQRGDWIDTGGDGGSYASGRNMGNRITSRMWA